MKTLTRREALRTCVTGAALSLAPRIRAATSSDKVRLAFIGVGGRGRSNVLNCAAHAYVAFADVDDVRAGDIYRQFPAVPRYRDYRAMLDQHAAQIDGVVISTPDHLHREMALAAMERGKHVYLEKPLAPTLWECREIQRAAERAGVQTQLGVHGHSFEALRVLREWIDAGAAGRIERVMLWSDRMSPQNFVQADEPAPGMAVPDTLDWSGWLGDRRERPYNPLYLPNRWRNWWDFGAGPVADIGVHMFDVLEFALELGAPVRVSAESSDRSRFTAPEWTRATWEFPARRGRGSLEVTWLGGYRNGQPVKPDTVSRLPAEVIAKTPNGIALVGTEATLFIPDMRASVRPRIYPLEREQGFIAALPARTLPRPKGGHHQDWLDAIREGRPASAPFSYGAPLTETVLLGTLAQRTGKPLRYDPESLRILDNPEAEELVQPVTRRA
jgi:predicted dehydrogenase